MPSALYIFWILHQTTTSRVLYIFQYSCISFESYIKPQPGLPADMIDEVVYLLNPTSNHNLVASVPGLWVLYIFWILHQTTTTPGNRPEFSCCISFESYIKPQHRYNHPLGYLSCISFESYIKPQHLMQPQRKYIVVYLLNPTSNHNIFICWAYYMPLYIFWILHQTTTTAFLHIVHEGLYIFWILHQTTTIFVSVKTPEVLYIFWILHQTTTFGLLMPVSFRCISFESYIKPQLSAKATGKTYVVYLLNPTSNHNWSSYSFICSKLYIFWILHQTTTLSATIFCITLLYIFWILHQTTTRSPSAIRSRCCISFESYIKPQLLWKRYVSTRVVYLLNPTSNHN